MKTYELYDTATESVLFEKEMDMNEVNHANGAMQSDDSDCRWIAKNQDLPPCVCK